MDIKWDAAKAAANYRKHGVRFSDAEAVLFDPLALTMVDVGSNKEQRFVSVGTDVLHRILVVIYAYRGDSIRLISARKATRKEIRAYEEGI
jgi:uncharacterized DUF497 family protein